MPLVTAKSLAKYYGAQDIFWDISLQIGHRDKIALVGPNGEGKSTLLRIIAGLEEPTAGQVHRTRRMRIGYLPQQAELAGERTLWQEMKQTFARLQDMEAELRRLEQRMTQEGSALPRYSALLEQFERDGGYAYEARIRQVLAGLGFGEEDFERPLAQFSGGEGTRALLARLLLESPDLLLLDEPTNHLDLQAIEWLENWLSNWLGSLVVVAHDHYFLDRVVHRVWDLSFGQLEAYPGNYSAYVQLRQERLERRRREYTVQQEFISRTEDFIRRYHAGQRSKEARGRATRLARLERLERPRQHRAIHLAIEPAMRSGDLVLAAQDLAVGYRDRLLFACPDLDLRRGDCAALLGPNGSGKTTFLRTFLEETQPLSGQIWLGHGVNVGYLPQRHESLDLESTVLDEILATRDLPLERARTLLGSFLFTGDDVFKRVGDLSGGERSRVALAKLTLQGANFLVLDEPTNHLDIISREVLIDVLARFGGTILFVSHDRTLIDRLATQLWVIQGQELVVYRGNYSDYLAARQEENGEEEATIRKPTLPRQDASHSGQEGAQEHRQHTAALEERIAGLEAQLGELEESLNLASQGRKIDELHRLGREYEVAQEELQELLDEWTRALA
jgi:ATP-binding cassette subfamily F protein 3